MEVDIGKSFVVGEKTERAKDKRKVDTEIVFFLTYINVYVYRFRGKFAINFLNKDAVTFFK